MTEHLTHHHAQAQGGGESPVHAIEGVAAPVAATPPLATLLTSHLIQDGEVILLILKPSLWYIVLSSLRFAAMVTIFVIGAIMLDERLPYQNRTYVEAGSILVALRLGWSALVWMGRLYVLTDLRVLRLAGVWRVEIFDCPLRKVARTRLLFTVKERLLGCGSIEIVPSDDEIPIGLWQTVARPRKVHEQIVAAVNRAKNSGRGCL